MQCYEILIAIPVIIVGAYILSKIYEHKKNWFKNDNWRIRRK
jgi:hypothetical protein